MFRRRPKAAQQADAAASRGARRASKQRRKTPPSGPLTDFQPRTAERDGSGDETAGQESSEPWYRQIEPLFDESFVDSRPAPPPQEPGGEATAVTFKPPMPADPAAAATLSSVPMIQRVGQVTDPGELPERMRSTFGPAPDAEDEPAADEIAAGALATEDEADDEPAADEVATADEPGAEEPTADTESRSESGMGFSDTASADDDGVSPGSPDPLIVFDPSDAASEDHDDAVPEDRDETVLGEHDDAALGSHDEAIPEEEGSEGGTDGASAPLATTADPPVAVAQHEPPVVVPVRGYYITRTHDTLRSVAAQFLNAPERWSELRTLNAAYPGIADLDADDLVPEGAAIALPGDPLTWGRPDPVYLWTLAETFLYTAWGREPTPEEVVPFWRGLTQGALPEGDQPPSGTELPGVAEIAARSADTDAEAPAGAMVPPVPPMPPAPFEMPAVAETREPSDEPPIPETDAETREPSDEPLAAEVPFDAPVDEDGTALVDLDAETTEASGEVDTADVETDVDLDADGIDTGPDVDGIDHTGPGVGVVTDADADTATFDTESMEAEAAGIIDAPAPFVDTAEMAGLVRAVEEAMEEARRADLEAPDDDGTGAVADTASAETIDTVDTASAETIDTEGDAGVIDVVDAEVPLAAEPPATAPPLQPEPPAPVPEPPAPPAPAAPPPIDTGPPASAEPPAPVLEPPPTFEDWLDQPSEAAPHDDPLAPYAGMPGPGAAEAPTLPPEAEAPRVPQFLPSVTGTMPTGPATAAPTSPVGRSLAGTAVGDAMLLWQLARRRRQSQRAAGAPDAIEQSLLATAGSESLELIEAAMRHLRAVTVGQQRPEPRVLAVRSGTYGFEVLLQQPVPTPPGWRSASGGYVLELPQGVTARDLDAIGQGPSLCPALVPVGNTFEGPLLLNLEQLGCLAISGPGAPAAGLLSAIVSALGSSPMAGHLRITAVGLDGSAGMIGWEAVGFMGYDSPELETLLANAYGPGDGVIELLAIGPGNDLLIQRAGQVATAPESRLSLVGATSAVSARWPWRIHVDDTGTAVVHPISITMNAARSVPPEALAPFGETANGGIGPPGLR